MQRNYTSYVLYFFLVRFALLIPIISSSSFGGTGKLHFCLLYATAGVCLVCVPHCVIEFWLNYMVLSVIYLQLCFCFLPCPFEHVAWLYSFHGCVFSHILQCQVFVYSAYHKHHLLLVMSLANYWCCMDWMGFSVSAVHNFLICHVQALYISCL